VVLRHPSVVEAYLGNREVPSVFEVRDVHVRLRGGHGTSRDLPRGSGERDRLPAGSQWRRKVHDLTHRFRPLASAEGEVLLDGKPIHGLSPVTIARRGISHVPEGRRVFPGLTVRENLSWGPRTPPTSAGRDGTRNGPDVKLFPIWSGSRSAPGWTLFRRAAANVAIARGLHWRGPKSS